MSWPFKKNPKPPTEAEVQRILMNLRQPPDVSGWTAGDKFKVIDGPFFGFSGEVLDVRHERGILHTSIVIFGRKTPVDLEVSQVEKINDA